MKIELFCEKCVEPQLMTKAPGLPYAQCPGDAQGGRKCGMPAWVWPDDGRYAIAAVLYTAGGHLDLRAIVSRVLESADAGFTGLAWNTSDSQQSIEGELSTWNVERNGEGLFVSHGDGEWSLDAPLIPVPIAEEEAKLFKADTALAAAVRRRRALEEWLKRRR